MQFEDEDDLPPRDIDEPAIKRNSNSINMNNSDNSISSNNSNNSISSNNSNNSSSINNNNNNNNDSIDNKLSNSSTSVSFNNSTELEDFLENYSDGDDDFGIPKDIDESIHINKKSKISINTFSISNDNDNIDFDFDDIDDSEFFFDDDNSNNNNNSNNSNGNNSNSNNSNSSNNNSYKNNIKYKNNNNNSNSNSDKFDKRLENFKKSGINKAKKRSLVANRTTTTPKIAPSFKIIHGTNFLVDGFIYKSEKYKDYFLTHFHSDHYVGITKTWSFGNIYCTEETGRLVKFKLGVDEKYIKCVPLNQTFRVDETDVTFYDANHCPGAAIIFFQVKMSNGQVENILHTGDFRWDSSMKHYQHLQDREISKLYLDNTFCNPEYTFPPQQSIFKQVRDLVRKENDGKTLFIFGTYVIGKEKILLEVAKQERKAIGVSNDKFAILGCLDSIDHSKFTLDLESTPFWAVQMGTIRFDSMSKVLGDCNGKYSRVIGIKPTGWSKSKRSQNYYTRGNMVIYNLAYSEHSSFNELRDCIEHLRPKEIIPTVDCDSEYKVKKILSNFEDIYKKKKEFSISSFFTVKPVSSFISSLFKSKSDIDYDSSTTSTTTAPNSFTSLTTCNSSSPSSNNDSGSNNKSFKLLNGGGGDDLILDCLNDKSTRDSSNDNNNYLIQNNNSNSLSSGKEYHIGSLKDLDKNEGKVISIQQPPLKRYNYSFDDSLLFTDDDDDDYNIKSTNGNININNNSSNNSSSSSSDSSGNNNNNSTNNNNDKIKSDTRDTSIIIDNKNNNQPNNNSLNKINNNNKQNNNDGDIVSNNSKLNLHKQLAENELVFDLDDPVFINQQKWIAQQIFNNSSGNTSSNNTLSTKNYKNKSPKSINNNNNNNNSIKKSHTNSPNSIKNQHNNSIGACNSSVKSSKSSLSNNHYLNKSSSTTTTTTLNINNSTNSTSSSQSLITSFFQK